MIGHIVVIVGVIWIFRDWIRSIEKRILKIILSVFSVLLIAAFSFSMFGSLAYSGNITETGEIIDVDSLGSLGGMLDTYSLQIKKADGSFAHYDTSIFSSRSLKKKIESLQVGDKVQIYSNNYRDIFYKVEILER